MWPRALLCLACLALACGRVDRDIGRYEPSLGSGDGGAAGAPGMPGPRPALNEPWPSSGCGQPEPTKATNADGYSSWEVVQSGATLNGERPDGGAVRPFLVRAPSDYDTNRPYRIVYLLRGGCNNGDVQTNVYDMANASLGGDPDAIYVDLAPAELAGGSDCYDTSSGPDSLEYEAFDLVHSLVESRYCVDNNRIFVAGYSQGSALSNMLGCYFGGIPKAPRKFSPRFAIRGHAAVDGWRQVNQPVPCGGPDAAIWIQDTGATPEVDDSNPSALTLALTTNGCDGNYTDGPKEAWPGAEGVAPLQPGDCQLYTGCSAQSQAEHPLVFCNVEASDTAGPSRADLAIPAFTAFFKSMDPSP